MNFSTDIQTGRAGYATLLNSDASGKSYVYLANNSATNNDAGVQEGGYGRLTIMHEVGHALGLKHPGNYNAGGGGSPGPFLSQALDNKQNTMMSYYDNGASKRVNSATPMIFDIAALQYLYGANKSASTASSNLGSATATRLSAEKPTLTYRIVYFSTTSPNNRPKANRPPASAAKEGPPIGLPIEQR